jgi:hypothetical protein
MTKYVAVLSPGPSGSTGVVLSSEEHPAKAKGKIKAKDSILFIVFID